MTEALELARLMRADIVNISLATDLPAYEFEQALRAAGEAGMLIVAGATLRDRLVQSTTPPRSRARPLVSSGGRLSALQAVAPHK